MDVSQRNVEDLPIPFSLEHGGLKHNVYRIGSGSPIILMHEITGMTPELIGLGHRIASSHFTVYLPHFFGPVGKRDEAAGFLFCLRREFNCFSRNKPSPIAEWLRELCRRASAECGGSGVGVIGLCLTGNVVLSMMTEPVVLVPVMCEPALPFLYKTSLGVPEVDLQIATHRNDALPLLAYRFDTDQKCPAEKFHALHNHFGDNAHLTTIPTGEAPFWIPDGSHSVLTGCYKDQDDPDHPIHHALDEILMAMRTRLSRHP
jgi:dienelactone hydrolase